MVKLGHVHTHVNKSLRDANDNDELTRIRSTADILIKTTLLVKLRNCLNGKLKFNLCPQ